MVNYQDFVILLNTLCDFTKLNSKMIRNFFLHRVFFVKSYQNFVILLNILYDFTQIRGNITHTLEQSNDA